MNTTLMEEKLKQAIDKKNTDINSFEWKGVKTIDDSGNYKQDSKRLVDMNSGELNACYDHCKKMLFNKDPQSPGRYLVLELIDEQRERCGAELFLRYVDVHHNLSRFSLIQTIRTFLSVNKDVFKETKPVIKHMFSGLPDEYENIHLNLILDGCLDRLGTFNKKHITRTFILKQGIWLTPTEVKELMAAETSKEVNRLQVIRDTLGIKEIENLYINSKGINYTQMRAMLNLKPNKKYTDLTTNQLETLRNRILFNLEEEVKKHITAWETRMGQIEMVAEAKEIVLIN